jgi:hypothetical protein
LSGVDRPIIGWKRAQLLLHPDPPHELRFAGPVEAANPYRADDVFSCRRGHHRLAVDCTCGFYAVLDRSLLRPSVTRTVLLEVELQGRVVRHPHCVRGERQLVRRVTIDGWCGFCVRPAAAVAGVAPLFGQPPPPWLYAVPVCASDQQLFSLTMPVSELADRIGTVVDRDLAGESQAAMSLRRLSRARRGAAW